MDSNALVKIQDIVDRYCTKRKLPLNDWGVYLEHAADCVRDLSIHHVRAFKTAQVHSVSTGIFDMPKDMIDLLSLSVPYNGTLWTLTEKGSLDTTTMQGYPELEADDGLVFFENFIDRQSFINRGGSVFGNPTWSSSSVTFDGTNDYLTIPINLNSYYQTHTLVIKLNVEDYTTQQYILDFTQSNGSGSLLISAADFTASSGTCYVDGTATTVVDDLGATYVVITGMSITSDILYIGCTKDGAKFYDGGIDYIAIYDYDWTAAEVTSGNTYDGAIAATSTSDLLNEKTTEYGARGGVNVYYFSPDWKKRKIFINGIPTETVILQYVSSGLNLTGDTYVPVEALPVVDAYLRWMQADIDGGGINERRDRERLYDKALMMLRKTYIPPASEFKDILLNITTQAPIR